MRLCPTCYDKVWLLSFGRLEDNSADVCTAISKMSSTKISHIHEDLTEKCALILYAYRKFCAASAAPTQVRLLSSLVSYMD